MANVRVVVANSPRLMRELVLATISDQSDIEIAGEIQEEKEIEHAVDQLRPDFLIVSLDKSDRLPDVCFTILREHPNLKIIAIAPDRERTLFYWASLGIHSSRIEASEEGVLNALRGKTQFVGS